MVEKIVTKYILALIKAQVITEKEKETYKYHIICAVESILVMLTMTGVGFYFHEVIHVWAFIACFFMIRNRTGGFHFDSFLEMLSRDSRIGNFCDLSGGLYKQ